MNQVYMLICAKPRKLQSLMQKLLRIKEISNMHSLYGQYDLILEIKAKDMNAIDDVIDKKIRKVEGIERTETLIVSDIPL